MQDLSQYTPSQLRELFSLTPKEFLQETIPANVLQITERPDSIKLMFTPPQWKDVIECLRAGLIANKKQYINFQYKTNPRSVTEPLLRAHGHVTKENIKELPRILIRAWSDITVYDLGAIHDQPN